MESPATGEQHGQDAPLAKRMAEPGAEPRALAITHSPVKDSLGGSKLLWEADPASPRIGVGNRLTPGQPADQKKDQDGRRGEKDGGEDSKSKDGEKDDQDEKDSDEKDSDDKTPGEKPQKNPEKKPAKKPLYKRPIPMTIIIAVVVIATVLAIIYFIHARHFIGTDDAFIDGHIIQVSPKVATLVKDVKINDNWLVTRGQELVTLDPRDFETALAQARANQDSMAGKLKQALSSKEASQANVTEAQAEVEVAQANYENANLNYQRFANLDARARSKQQLDDSTAAQRSAGAQVAEAKAKVVAMQAQVANSDSAITTAQADLGDAEQKVRQAELNVDYCTIVAPEDGYITNKSVEPGAYVSVGQALFAIVPKDVWVVANYKETELDHIRPGQPVSISVDAYPDKKFKGKVDSVMAGAGARFSLLPPENATGNYIKVVQRVPVKIDIDPDDLADTNHILGPGMSVEPSIDVRSALH